MIRAYAPPSPAQPSWADSRTVVCESLPAVGFTAVHQNTADDFAIVTKRVVSYYEVDGYKRRGGREAEGGGLLNRCRGQNSYRGVESPPLRHSLSTSTVRTYRLYALIVCPAANHRCGGAAELLA